MKNLVVVLLLVFTTGCTHYLYQGDFNARNNVDETSHFRLWWTRTEPLLGDDKAGPMILDVACGVTVEFTESQRGIEFIAATDSYEPMAGQSIAPLVCGKVTNLNQFLTYKKGDIELTSSCRPIVDDEGFSAVVPIYLFADQASYRVPITVTEEWSFYDKALSAPKLDCP